MILTGSGSDGAAGAVEERSRRRDHSEPEDRYLSSMPQSLPPTIVDHVVEIEQIGPLLSDLLKGIAWYRKSKTLCAIC